MATTRSLALALTVAVALPSAAAGLPPLPFLGDGPTLDHQLAERACRETSALDTLLTSAADAGLAPLAVPSVDLDVSYGVGLAHLYASLGHDIPDGFAEHVAQVGPAVGAVAGVLAEALADAIDLHDTATGPADLAPDITALALMLHAAQAMETPAREAVADGRWPRNDPVADPLGIVRIGSSGNDVETIDRLLLIDPAGDDRYYGRVAGSYDIFTRAALGIDYAGNDVHDAAINKVHTLAGTSQGPVLFYDATGNDVYMTRQSASGHAAGYAGGGAALFLDASGNDRHEHTSLGRSLGMSEGGYALTLDLEGDDTSSASDGLGYSRAQAAGAVGFMCDRAGSDSYTVSSGWGVGYGARPEARAWFADVGGTPDAYTIYASPPAVPVHPAANGAYWTAGRNGGVGHGLDR